MPALVRMDSREGFLGEVVPTTCAQETNPLSTKNDPGSQPDGISSENPGS